MARIKYIWCSIILTLLFLYYYLYSILIERTSFCQWKVFYSNTYDKNRSKIVKYYIDFLKKMKIVYFLGFGSELGAIRNGGLIWKDHDMDIIIPIWLNYRIFKCNKYIFYYPAKCNIYTQKEVKVCNKTKYDYMIILKEYIENIVGEKVDYNCRLWGKYGYTSCWIFYKSNIFLDLWILIGNEYIYQNINICKCKFSKYITYCAKNAIKNVYRMYGEKWHIPVVKGSGVKCCNIVLYPNYNNSILRYTI